MNQMYDRMVMNHMPKSGGSYVKSYFKHNTDWPVKAYRSINMLPDIVPEDNTFSSSHQAFQEFKPTESDFYFTFTRHPVDVFFSHYYFVNSVKDKHPDVWPDNDANGELLTRNIMFDAPMQDYVDWFMSDLTENNFKKSYFFMNFYKTLLTNEYTFIGVLENMGEAMYSLCTQVGVEYKPEAWAHHNENRDKTADYTYRRDELEEIFANQIEIYDQVVSGINYEI
jgi:hypothetical protein